MHQGTEFTPSGELFIISAPSGAGKTTLINRLLRGDMDGLSFSVSHTTRKPRVEEVDGVDYHFTDRKHFEESIDRGDFLEWAEVHGNLYGTALAEVRPRLAAGLDVLLDIDVQGGERVMADQRGTDKPSLGTGVHSIFVMPPSFEELEKRLRQRNQDKPDQIASRLDVSRWEMSRAEAYDYVIVNDDARFASGVLASIIVDKRHRGTRMRPRVVQILRDFQTV
jgi:guanylate kinase